MKKIGLIIDSSSGLTIKEANDKGHSFIPLQISINGEVKRAGVDIEIDELYDVMQDKKKVQIKTSLAPGDEIEKAFDWILERCEKAIYIGLTHKLSGNQNAVRNLANGNEKYKDKIYVYNSQYSSPWTKMYINDIEKLLEQTDDFEEIKTVLDKANEHMFGLLSPGDIYWFYKGGRISKSAYMMGSLLKITPILTVRDGRIESENVVKARGIDNAIEKIIKITKERVKTLDEKGIPFTLLTMKSNDDELSEKMFKRVNEEFDMTRIKVIQSGLSSEQTAHMGPGSCGLAIHVGLFDIK